MKPKKRRRRMRVLKTGLVACVLIVVAWAVSVPCGFGFACEGLSVFCVHGVIVGETWHSPLSYDDWFEFLEDLAEVVVRKHEA